MSWLAWHLHQRGRPVAANYHLHFDHDRLPVVPEKERGEPIEDWVRRASAAFADLDEHVVLLDEAHILVDSRLTGTQRNIAWSYLFTQARKRELDVLFTTQSFHQVELRLRDLCTAVVSCRSIGDYTVGTVLAPDAGAWRRTGRLLLHRPAAYHLFDTREVVT
jgi:hypothetical protein